MAVIGDIITGTGTTIGLYQILNQRSDVVATSTSYQAIVVAAIREITESYPFDELRVTGPNFSLVPGTSLYPITSWLNSGDTNPTQIVSFALVLPSTTSTDDVSMLDWKNPKELEPMTAVSAMSKGWTRFGSNIIVGPNPDQAYVTYMRYQNSHPFTANPLQNQTIYVPDSWLEIITYAAGIRAGLMLRANDISTECHNILYGDPEYVNSQGKRGRPGIIAARLFNQERDSSHNAGSMVPVVDSYI